MSLLTRCIPVLFMVFTTAAVAALEVRIYEPGMLTRDRYEIVSRLWVESWRSALQVPTYATREEAVDGLKKEAARRGANALTNIACLKDDAPFPGSASHFCYALAIRVK